MASAAVKNTTGLVDLTAIGGYIAALSFRRGKKIFWDEKTQKCSFA